MTPPTFNTFLRGVSFRPIEAKVIVTNLDDDANLMIERDHANPYDSNAVKVIEPDSLEFIGFVAKECAVDLAPWMDKGHHFTCRADGRVQTYVLCLVIEPVLSADEEQKVETPATVT